MTATCNRCEVRQYEAHVEVFRCGSTDWAYRFVAPGQIGDAVSGPVNHDACLREAHYWALRMGVPVKDKAGKVLIQR